MMMADLWLQKSFFIHHIHYSGLPQRQPKKNVGEGYVIKRAGREIKLDLHPVFSSFQINWHNVCSNVCAWFFWLDPIQLAVGTQRNLRANYWFGISFLALDVTFRQVLRAVADGQSNSAPWDLLFLKTAFFFSFCRFILYLFSFFSLLKKENNKTIGKNWKEKNKQTLAV